MYIGLLEHFQLHSKLVSKCIFVLVGTSLQLRERKMAQWVHLQRHYFIEIILNTVNDLLIELFFSQMLVYFNR